MGADGHISYFDADIVEKIKEEVQKKYPDEEICFYGYTCSYTVAAHRVVMSYWDSDLRGLCGWGAEGSQIEEDPEGRNEGQKEFAKRIVTEAIVVEDQEVWT